jgi:CubicO group peptidase (beta-lactamase class C family)
VVLAGCHRRTRYAFTFASPESAGFSSEKLQVLEDHLEQSGAASMFILVKGDVIFEWGETDRKHTVHSIRKALLNSLVGIAVEEGRIDTTSTLAELGIQDIEPRLTENELNARVADLLKSRSGVYHHAAGVSEGMLAGMPGRGAHGPGAFYYYNNWDFNTLGAILEQATGRSIYELFHKQIAVPLGMHDYRGSYVSINAGEEGVDIPDTDGFYQYEPGKSSYPAYHFRMSARDLAIYGQLYLDHGTWQGEQLIPRAWIDASTQPYSVYNPQYGLAYGMLWRVLVPGPDTRRNSFLHTGVGIHMLGIYPDLDMVVVHRVDTENRDDYQQADFYRMIELLFSSRK